MSNGNHTWLALVDIYGSILSALAILGLIFVAGCFIVGICLKYRESRIIGSYRRRGYGR